MGAYRLALNLATAGGDHRMAFAGYHAGHRDLVAKKQQIGPNVRLMVPKTNGGRRVRDMLAKLPLMRAMGAVERMLQRKVALPEYVAAG